MSLSLATISFEGPEQVFQKVVSHKIKCEFKNGGTDIKLNTMHATRKTL